MRIENHEEQLERQFTYGLTDLEVYEAVEREGDEAWANLQRMDVRLGDEIVNMDGGVLVAEVVRGSDGYPRLRLTKDGQERYEQVKGDDAEFYVRYFNETAQERFIAAKRQVEIDAARHLRFLEEELDRQIMNGSIPSCDPTEP